MQGTTSDRFASASESSRPSCAPSRAAKSKLRPEVFFCSFALAFPQLLRRHAQSAVEFARSVFPRDDRGQFNKLVVTVNLAQARKHFIAHFSPGDRHSVCVSKRDSLGLAVERACSI